MAADSYGMPDSEILPTRDAADERVPSPSHWLLAVSSPAGLSMVPETGLVATSAGLAVVRPEGRVVASWDWSAVDEVRVGRELPAPDGAIAQRLVDVAIGEKRHLFVSSESAVASFVADVEQYGAMHRDQMGSSYSKDAHGSKGLRKRAARRPQRASAEYNSEVEESPSDKKRGRKRLIPFAASALALTMTVGGILAGTFGARPPSEATAFVPSGSDMPNASTAQSFESQYAGRDLALAPATTAPAPAPPSLAGAPALKPHEIFGFAPYWTLPSADKFNVTGLTTLSYFSVDVNGDGSIDRSGPGWAGYESQDLSDLVTRAHEADDRVVLTVTCFAASALSSLTSDPQAPATLSSSLVQLLSAKNLDGVNIDFEGTGSADQQGLDRLVAAVSQALHAADSHWQVTMDTYASAAGDPLGFYDIKGLAPSVDAFFVMAYDMNERSSPSPTAALTGSDFSDSQAISQYTAVVPASKVILGVPYYGYDWPTTGPAQADAATGPPTPESYSQIAAANHPVYWDAQTQTPWTSYQVGSQWHQTFFDDATSLALKAQLADSAHLAGLGVWALGMDGNDPSMLAALLGNAPAVKDFQPAPSRGPETEALRSPTNSDGASVPPGEGSSPTSSTTTTTTTSPPPSTTTSTTSSTPTTTTTTESQYRYTGDWNGSSVDLEKIDPRTVSGLAVRPGQGAAPNSVAPSSQKGQGAGSDPAVAQGQGPEVPVAPGSPVPAVTVGAQTGELTGFTTDDPAVACLDQAPSLPVYPVMGTGDLYVVYASSPDACAAGTWEFVATPQAATVAAQSRSTASSTRSQNAEHLLTLRKPRNRGRRDRIAIRLQSPWGVTAGA